MDEALIKKIPPHSVEAERAVIGSMMMDKDAILVSSEILSAEDFIRTVRRAFYGFGGVISKWSCYRSGHVTEQIA